MKGLYRLAFVVLMLVLDQAAGDRAAAVVTALPVPSDDTMPTPQPTDLAPSIPYPTPRSTGLSRPSQTLAPVVDDSKLPRTEVHVLEKCCPYITQYAVRTYPSVLVEEHGWIPALTFHAFAHHRALPNCWRIANATDKHLVAPPGSHVWERIPPGSQPADTAASFCLPTKTRLPGPRQAMFYVTAPDGSASFVSEPMSNVSDRFVNAFSLPGWSTRGTATPTPAPTTNQVPALRRADFSAFYPLAYYYWRPILPMNVIADVRIQVSRSEATAKCPTGYDIVPGNLNHNFVLDPYVGFCIKHVPKRVLNPHLSVPREYTEGKYVTALKIKPRSTNLVNMRRDNETADIVDCPSPWELVPTKLDASEKRGIVERQVQLIQKLNRTFDASNFTDEFSVLTGFGEWLSFCSLTQELYLSGAELRNASEFVDQISLDYSQIARKKRLVTVYNAESSHPMKVAPHGRLKYVKAQAVEGERGAPSSKAMPAARVSDEL